MNGKMFLKKNGGTILTCIGAAGVMFTTALAIKSTPKAVLLLEEAEKEKEEELTNWEKVKVVLPVYIPTVISGATTIACIFGANVFSYRTQASLASAYALLDNSYKEYKAKLIELYGVETHENVVEAIAAEKAEKIYIGAPNLTCNSKLYLDDYHGQRMLFYDEYGKRYFESTLERVLNAEYYLNRNYTMSGAATLNEFYSFLGISELKETELLGWAVSDYDELYWIDFNHRLIDVKGEECVVIEMPFGPSTRWLELCGYE